MSLRKVISLGAILLFGVGLVGCGQSPETPATTRVSALEHSPEGWWCSRCRRAAAGVAVLELEVWTAEALSGWGWDSGWGRGWVACRWTWSWWAGLG